MIRHAVLRVFNIICILATSSALAQSDPEQLLRSVEAGTFRPTLTEFVQFVRQHPEVIPLLESNLVSPNDVRREDLLASLPGLIATLEKFYPQGTYAFLGRDMSLAADAVEAVYLVFGQPERVKRLGFSTQTYTDYRANPSSQPGILDFLKANGFDEEGTRPFVLVDSTSFLDPSQSTFLMSHLFPEPLERSLWEQRALRVGVLTAMPGARAWELSREAFQKGILSGERTVVRLGRTFPEPLSFPELSRFAHRAQTLWHGPFRLPFVLRSDGTITGTPSYDDRPRRRLALALMWRVYGVIASEDFQMRLREVLREKGIDADRLRASACAEALVPEAS